MVGARATARVGPPMPKNSTVLTPTSTVTTGLLSTNTGVRQVMRVEDPPTWEAAVMPPPLPKRHWRVPPGTKPVPERVMTWEPTTATEAGEMSVMVSGR